MYIEEHYNLGITNDHINVIYKDFFNKIMANYLNNDIILLVSLILL